MSTTRGTIVTRPEEIHFLHIGKTGGTAVKYALSHADRPGLRVHLHPHVIKLADLPLGDMAVFFLRDPLTRFVSGFYSRQRRGQPRYNNPWSDAEAQAFGLFQTANDLALALSSDDDLLRGCAVAAMQNIAHVRLFYS